MTTVQAIAKWASTLTLSDIPSGVIDLCRAQRRSVFGAIAASSKDAATRRVAKGALSFAGQNNTTSTLYCAVAASIALDFDDYAAFGHTGHSAVLVPIVVGAAAGASGVEQLVAQTVSNEVAARLGGACLIGPLNGQLWSFIHAAGTALAAGRLLGLSSEKLAHALAISLTNAPRPTVAGFMAPDTKLLTAAEPVLAGLRAVHLAAAGVTGPLDILDSRDGFLPAFAFVPLPHLLDGLGNGWATRTLCVKPYPGCAYVDTLIEALSEISVIDPGSVKRVEIRASLLTTQMDRLSHRYCTPPPTPVTVNFSVGWTAAIVMLAGELTPMHVRNEWLSEHADELAELRSRVHLSHDWNATRRVMASFMPLIPPRLLGKQASPAAMLRGIRSLHAQHRGLPVSLRDVPELVRMFGQAQIGSASTPSTFWDDDALAEFQMALPAEARVEFTSGQKEVARIDIPRGAAGHPTASPASVASEKLQRWGPLRWSEKSLASLDNAIESDAQDLASWLA